jgi:hypothetical protein
VGHHDGLTRILTRANATHVKQCTNDVKNEFSRAEPRANATHVKQFTDDMKKSLAGLSPVLTRRTSNNAQTT